MAQVVSTFLCLTVSEPILIETIASYQSPKELFSIQQGVYSGSYWLKSSQLCLIVSWFWLKLAHCLKNQRERLSASHWKARWSEQRVSTAWVRTEHGSLKNRQSRSSGKVQSSISGKLLSPQKNVCIVSLDPITNVSTSSPVICLFRLIWDNRNEYIISSAILLGQVSLRFESLSRNEPLWTMPLCLHRS